MDKRYQVFVSSTFHDLQEERKEVMQALLELDCIPSGMELFQAANESQWSLIKKVIEDCDYYILIMAGRYGSIGSGGLSYTEMEYRYAESLKKPIIAFVHKDPDSIPVRKTENGIESKEKLRVFREMVRQKMCKEWTNASDLGAAVSRSLVRLMKIEPATGWIRGDQILEQEGVSELMKLRKQVRELKKQLVQPPAEAESLSKGDESFLIKFSFRAGISKRQRMRINSDLVTTWNSIFAYTAPSLMREVSEHSFKALLDEFVGTEASAQLSKKGRYFPPIDGFKIEEQVFHTIKIQLRALGLIRMIDRDNYPQWTLTPYGDSMMVNLRAIKAKRELGQGAKRIRFVQKENE